MYKKDKILLLIVWIISFVVSYAFSFSYSVDVSGQIITILSIFFGFYVTSAALVASSHIFSELHSIEDKRGDRRLSHTLRDYYKFGFSTLLIGIILFLLVSFFTTTDRIGYMRSILTDFDKAILLNAFASAQLVICLTFSFIHTHLFMILFNNEAYSKAGTISRS